MNIKTQDNLVIDVARLHTMKDAAEKMGIYPSQVYILKLKGELEIIQVAGYELVVEPVGGFIKKQKKVIK